VVAADKGEGSIDGGDVVAPTMVSTTASVGVGSMGQQKIIGAVKGMEVWDLLVLPDNNDDNSRVEVASTCNCNNKGIHCSMAILSQHPLLQMLQYPQQRLRDRYYKIIIH
jgi:hypothetical protein